MEIGSLSVVYTSVVGEGGSGLMGQGVVFGGAQRCRGSSANYRVAQQKLTLIGTCFLRCALIACTLLQTSGWTLDSGP